MLVCGYCSPCLLPAKSSSLIVPVLIIKVRVVVVVVVELAGCRFVELCQSVRVREGVGE